MVFPQVYMERGSWARLVLETVTFSVRDLPFKYCSIPVLPTSTCSKGRTENSIQGEEGQGELAGMDGKET